MILFQAFINFNVVVGNWTNTRWQFNKCKLSILQINVWKIELDTQNLLTEKCIIKISIWSYINFSAEVLNRILKIKSRETYCK